MVGGDAFSSTSYVVTFREPSDTALLALKGYEGSEYLAAGLRLKCISDRPMSPWNFESEVNTGWTAVSSIRIPNYRADNFREGWNLASFSGTPGVAVQYSGPALGLNLTTSFCGNPGTVKSLGHLQGQQSPRSWYWALRRLVVQPYPCGTEVPTSSPTTPAPTLAPSTMAPVSSPSSAPTVPTSPCIPGDVTCCITAQERIVQLFVNEVEVTGHLQPLSALSNASVAKTISFTEPSGPAMFAIKGYEYNELKTAALALICTSSRPGSAWNFQSDTDANWKYLLSNSTSGDAFPTNWYSNLNYTGLAEFDAPLSTERISLNTEVCGAVDDAKKIQVVQGVPPRRYWALKLFVNQTEQCGTQGPTVVATPGPTFAPTTLAPTQNPTLPTPLPVSPPSNLPTSVAPTKLPSSSPSSSPTIFTTGMPTSQPTPCEQPGTVTCCFTGYRDIVDMYVNDLPVTLQIVQQSQLNETSATKTISFTEPANAAVIAIKGFENNEIIPASLSLRCHCSRANSAWNFDTSPAFQWQSVFSTVTRTDSFPEDWYKLSYAGAGMVFASNTNVPTGYTVDTVTCGGAAQTAGKLVVPQSNPARFYWSMRLLVDQTICAPPAVTSAPNPAQNVADGGKEETLPSQGDDASNAGVIAGAVVGALAFTALVAGLLIRSRRSSADGAAAGSPGKDWDEQTDEASGTKFWVNRKTGEFSWTSPYATTTTSGEHVLAAASLAGGRTAAADAAILSMDRRTGEFSYAAAPATMMPNTPPPKRMAPAASTPVPSPVPPPSFVNRKTGEFSYASPHASSPSTSPPRRMMSPASPAPPSAPSSANRKTGEFSSVASYINDDGGADLL